MTFTTLFKTVRTVHKLKQLNWTHCSMISSQAILDHDRMADTRNNCARGRQRAHTASERGTNDSQACCAKCSISYDKYIYRTSLCLLLEIAMYIKLRSKFQTTGTDSTERHLFANVANQVRNIDIWKCAEMAPLSTK